MPETCATCAFAVNWRVKDATKGMVRAEGVTELILADCPYQGYPVTRYGVCGCFHSVPGAPCGGLLANHVRGE